MSDEDRREALRQLVQQWREKVMVIGRLEGAAFEFCAAELEAALLADGGVRAALLKLANEAQGFLDMAAPAQHGLSNMAILRQRIDEARAGAHVMSDDLTPLDEFAAVLVAHGYTLNQALEIGELVWEAQQEGYQHGLAEADATRHDRTRPQMGPRPV